MKGKGGGGACLLGDGIGDKRGGFAGDAVGGTGRAVCAYTHDFGGIYLQLVGGHFS